LSAKRIRLEQLLEQQSKLRYRRQTENIFSVTNRSAPLHFRTLKNVGSERERAKCKSKVAFLEDCCFGRESLVKGLSEKISVCVA